MIIIKNVQQIEKMRKSCALVKEAHEMLAQAIVPDITTRELDDIVVKFLKSRGAKPSFKNYRGFPKSICVSINEEIVHGIPGSRRLRDGDIVSIDVGAYFDGFHGDAARTYAVGQVAPAALELIQVTEQSFFAGMKYARVGHFLHEISAAIQEYAQSHGFGVIEDYVGHGIGANLHEDPEIPNFKQKNRGSKLRAGMTLAIEPMICLGSHEVVIMDDEWTAVTKDGSLAAHYEDTILITNGDPEILTL